MNESNHNHTQPGGAPTPEEISRRNFFTKLSVSLGGLCAAIMAVPLVGFVVGPLFHKVPDIWVPVGKIDEFETGKTISVTFHEPSPLPWAGVTAKAAAWLRRDKNGGFTAFSVNCTHMGCPVRWMQDAELFLCPCHGGVYYKDGTVAAGPPPEPLVRFEVRVVNGQVEIKTAPIPITTKL